MLTIMLYAYRTVPTEDQILVPETLLKKRKSQEKAREERSAELEKKKAVGAPLRASKLRCEGSFPDVDDGDDAYQFSRLDPSRSMLSLLTIFRV